jgi:hypothetical protein
MAEDAPGDGECADGEQRGPADNKQAKKNSCHAIPASMWLNRSAGMMLARNCRAAGDTYR